MAPSHEPSEDQGILTLENLKNHEEHIEKISRLLGKILILFRFFIKIFLYHSETSSVLFILGDAWQDIMGEIPSPKFPEQCRFTPKDVDLLKNLPPAAPPHQAFSDFIKNWSTMGKIRRPNVSDLLVICYDRKELETAKYIYKVCVFFYI